MERKLYHKILCAMGAVICGCTVTVCESSAQPGISNYEHAIDFTFSEPARGGTLELVNKRHELRHLSIAVATSPGESPDTVRALFRNRLLEYPLDEFLISVKFLEKESDIQSWRDSPFMYLPGIPGEMILGGTETGLGILPPVGSLSAGFDSATKSHTFRWHEKSPYDEVNLCALGGPGLRVRGERDITKDEPFISLPADLPVGGYRYFFLLGFRDGLPTNGSYIYTKADEQIEYFYHPFTNGIASNWTGWGVTEAASPHFEEKIYPNMEEETRVTPMRLKRIHEVVSRCAQRIHSDRPGVRGGMYRFFIAQTHGRVYRPALRCQILEEDAAFAGDWSFEIMTGTLDPELAYEMDYAARILSGDYWQELSTRGSQISVWRFDNSTKGAGVWMMNQTGAADSDIPQKDIVLGKEKTAVFFCVRLSGHKPNGIVMDGVRLVDVTDGFRNAEIRKKVL